MIPKDWNISGLKLKDTKVILRIYQEMYADPETAPSDSHCAIMSLWDNPQLTENYAHDKIGIMIHNLRFRLACAYIIEYKDLKNKITVHQAIGMLAQDKYRALIDHAIALPAGFCGDFYKATK